MNDRHKGFSTILAVVVIALIAAGAWIAVKKYPRSFQSTLMPTPSSETSVSATVTPAPQANEITLTVDAPTDKSTVSASSVTVRGKTVAGADVFVNDTEGKADAKGEYAISVSLGEGDNPLVVVANDAEGHSSEKDVTVTYAP